ncbi:MAG: AbrB/MazE/SpoVT family DNA-binding domain-containing protein [Candidatus Paceibacterota bacterium]|jgi:antitoxin MazE
MTTKIQRWGNSLGVRLPKAIFASGKFSEGSVVVFDQKGSELVLRVVKPKYPSLKEIMKNIDPSVFHPLIDFGPDVGKEIIE